MVGNNHECGDQMDSNPRQDGTEATKNKKRANLLECEYCHLVTILCDIKGGGGERVNSLFFFNSGLFLLVCEYCDILSKNKSLHCRAKHN